MTLEELNLKQKDLKKDYIINVAKELFFKYGYVNTTINQIAKASKLSKSTFYSYVKSKEEILLTIHKNGMIQRFSLLKESLDEEETGLDKIYKFGEKYYEFFMKNKGLFKLSVFMDFNSISKENVTEKTYQEYIKALNNFIELIRGSLALGIKDGTIKKEINLGYYDMYLAYNLRTVLNLSLNPQRTHILVENFSAKEFYFQYLDMFIQFLKS